jgi:hypothetical protein
MLKGNEGGNGSVEIRFARIVVSGSCGVGEGIDYCKNVTSVKTLKFKTKRLK